MEKEGLWSTNEDDALFLIDQELEKAQKEYIKKYPDSTIVVNYTWDSSSGSIDDWHKYCQKQKRDSFEILDQKIIFSNEKTVREDFASKKLNYPLEKGSIESYDKLISVLYDEENRHKIEWAIGSIVSGDSTKLQKFCVFYGASGTGKSTILNIIQDMFEGYCTVFDARVLGQSSASFALEPFKNNPLVAIQHDGDLSKIEDNTRLNSLTSHELMTVNEKYKSAYASRFKTFLFMGTNKPVKITDARSGLTRRLIDITPTGNKVPSKEYSRLVKTIPFELGAIAYHCKKVYLDNPDYYNEYKPLSMMSATNDFFNFMLNSYMVFKDSDGTTLKAAWEMYKTYCEEANVPFQMSQRVFKEELKVYFDDFDDRLRGDGGRLRNYYSGFKIKMFMDNKKDLDNEEKEDNKYIIDFKEQHSIFDDVCKDCPAQLANADQKPNKKWADVKTTLQAINTKKLHYVKIPENHIVIDFDIKDDNGNKSYEKNLEAASKFPKTYAELSKSGAGIHLHYIYTGDVTKLNRLYADDIEVKVFSGDSSLRRKLTKCNNLEIATLSSGLPIRKEKKMINKEVIVNENTIRKLIIRNLNKEIHPGTKPSIDFIYKILEDAYESGVKFDVSDMKNEIYAFAVQSTNQSEYCIKLVGKMHFKSEEPSEYVKSEKSQIAFYDVEVFPNLFVIVFKLKGKENPLIPLINPGPKEIEELLKYNLVGFNCRRYDNHIIYGRLLGYNNEQTFNLSKRIINNEKNSLFGEAYNLSYTDIYDFASSYNKKSLKKLEIEMGIHHEELGLPWDKPVPDNMLEKVVTYCGYDVLATEAAWDYLESDFLARQILADIADMSVNDTTNTLTTKIIFGNDKNPQGTFFYRDLSKPVKDINPDILNFLKKAKPDMMKNKFHGIDGNESILPYFPGYKYEYGKSVYRGEEVGEGGYVYSEPGMYENIALLDVASMHPNTVISECFFGPKYTEIFKSIVDARIDIKHEDWDKLNSIFNGKLTKYTEDVKSGRLTSKQLSNALKTAINSVYGLTAANFKNPFKDDRNADNLVAKRGALFMIDLKHAVQEMGYTVAHIKTDSIKIPNADQKIIDFVMDFGKKYGYTFEHEDTYKKMCLVNDAVYIAKNKKGEWTATGTQFAIPYVFKTLFSKEPITFQDLCDTKSVTSALYLDFNEQLPDVSEQEKEYVKLVTKFKKKLISEETFDKVSKELLSEIDKGHDYTFVGKVGQFCPILPNKGGGLLCREKDGKFYSATGSKGYRWLESEFIKGKFEDRIDRSYFDELVNEAIETINKYGDFEMFVADDERVIDCFNCEHFDNGTCIYGRSIDNYILL